MQSTGCHANPGPGPPGPVPNPPPGGQVPSVLPACKSPCQNNWCDIKGINCVSIDKSKYPIRFIIWNNSKESINFSFDPGKNPTGDIKIINSNASPTSPTSSLSANYKITQDKTLELYLPSNTSWVSGIGWPTLKSVVNAQVHSQAVEWTLNDPNAPNSIDIDITAVNSANINMQIGVYNGNKLQKTTSSACNPFVLTDSNFGIPSDLKVWDCTSNVNPDKEQCQTTTDISSPSPPGKQRLVLSDKWYLSNTSNTFAPLSSSASPWCTRADSSYCFDNQTDPCCLTQCPVSEFVEPTSTNNVGPYDGLARPCRRYFAQGTPQTYASLTSWNNDYPDTGSAPGSNYCKWLGKDNKCTSYCWTLNEKICKTDDCPSIKETKKDSYPYGEDQDSIKKWEANKTKNMIDNPLPNKSVTFKATDQITILIKIDYILGQNTGTTP